MMGFRMGLQSAEVIPVVRALLERLKGRGSPRCISRMDLVHAYDYIKHSAAIHTMEPKHDMPCSRGDLREVELALRYH